MVIIQNLKKYQVCTNSGPCCQLTWPLPTVVPPPSPELWVSHCPHPPICRCGVSLNLTCSRRGLTLIHAKRKGLIIIRVCNQLVLFHKQGPNHDYSLHQPDLYILVYIMVLLISGGLNTSTLWSTRSLVVGMIQGSLLFSKIKFSINPDLRSLSFS